MNALLKVGAAVVLSTVAFVHTGIFLHGLSGGGGGGGAGEVSAAAGEGIFWGRGKCSTCHSLGAEGSAVRCPNLGVFGEQLKEPVGVRAAGRPGAVSAIDYLVASLYRPNDYVLPGFPKGLMTPAQRPPIGLSDDEIASVVLYLLVKSDMRAGRQQIEQIRRAQRKYATALTGDDEAPVPGISLLGGEPDMGLEAFAKMQCHRCHAVKGVTFGSVEPGKDDVVAPELTSIGSIQTYDYLVESMLDPSAVIVADPPGAVPGEKGSYRAKDGLSRMPEFHDTMTVRQMLDIAAFLETLEGQEKNAAQWGKR